MKFPAENPWNGAAEKFAVGNVVKGVVARMTDFGAFVELGIVCFTPIIYTSNLQTTSTSVWFLVAK